MNLGDRVRVIAPLTVRVPSQVKQEWRDLIGMEATLIAYEPASAYRTPYVLEFDARLFGQVEPAPHFHHCCRCEAFHIAVAEDSDFDSLFPRNAVGEYREYE